MTDRQTHWLESPISLWQLVASILGLVIGGSAAWVSGDRAQEGRMTRLEVRQETVMAQQRQQDTTIELLRLTAENNRIALGEIRAVLQGNVQRLDAITTALETMRQQRR